MLRKISFKFLVCALAILFFVSEGQAGNVRVGVPTLSLVVIAFTAAKEKGYYKEEGLDVELVWMSAPPFHVIAQEAGYRELVSFLKEDFVELQGSIVVREEIFKSAPVMLEKFVRASLKGLTYAREQRWGTIAILVRYLKIKEDEAAKYYDSVRSVMTVDGTVPEDHQKKFLQVAARRLRAKETPALEKAFDYSLVKKIYAELQTKGWRPKP